MSEVPPPSYWDVATEPVKVHPPIYEPPVEPGRRMTKTLKQPAYRDDDDDYSSRRGKDPMRRYRRPVFNVSPTTPLHH